MRKLLMSLLLILISVSIFAESQSFFAYGFKRGLRNHDFHTYVMVDFEEETMVIITDWNNDWRITEEEVWIYSVIPVGEPFDAVWEIENLLFEVKGNKGTLYIAQPEDGETTKIIMEWSDMVFSRRY